MAKPNIENLSKDQLQAKKKSLKVFIGIFIVLIIALFFFIIKDYIDGEELDWSTLTIAICTIGGPVTLYPELKAINDELKIRDEI